MILKDALEVFHAGQPVKRIYNQNYIVYDRDDAARIGYLDELKMSYFLGAWASVIHRYQLNTSIIFTNDITLIDNLNFFRLEVDGTKQSVIGSVTIDLANSTANIYIYSLQYISLPRDCHGLFKGGKIDRYENFVADHWLTYYEVTQKYRTSKTKQEIDEIWNESYKKEDKYKGTLGFIRDENDIHNYLGYKTDGMIAFDNYITSINFGNNIILTNNTKYMDYMFSGLSGLSGDLNLNDFTFESLIDIQGMFNAMGAENIIIPSKPNDVDLIEVHSFGNLFAGSSNLKTYQNFLSYFDSSKVYDFYCMFEDCSSLIETTVVFEGISVAAINNNKKYYYPSLHSMIRGSSIEHLTLNAYDNNVIYITDTNYNGFGLDCCLGANNLISFSTNIRADKYRRSFKNCSKLQTAVLPIANTVSIFEEMFYGCSSLISFDFDSIPLPFSSSLMMFTDTFRGCTNLQSVNFGDRFGRSEGSGTSTEWISDVDNIYASHMFYGCNSLTTITGPFSFLTVVDYMFAECHSLTNLSDIYPFFEGLFFIGRSLQGMFKNCRSLTELRISEGGWSERSKMQYDQGTRPLSDSTGYMHSYRLVVDYSYMFYGCENLESIYGEGVEFMFGGTIYYDNNHRETKRSINKEVNLNYMFTNCKKLTSIANWFRETTILSKVNRMVDCFKGCTLLTDLGDFSKIKFQPILNERGYIPGGDIFAGTGFEGTFQDCTSLVEIDFKDSLGSSNEFEPTSRTPYCYNSKNMFKNCSNLETITFNYYAPHEDRFIENYSGFTNSSGMFENCSILETLDTIPIGQCAQFDEQYYYQDLNRFRILNISNLFKNCSSLAKINVKIPYGISNLYDPTLELWLQFPIILHNAFSGCTNLNWIKWRRPGTSEVTPGHEQEYFYEWNTSLYGDYNIFNGCTNLKVFGQTQDNDYDIYQTILVDDITRNDKDDLYLLKYLAAVANTPYDMNNDTNRQLGALTKYDTDDTLLQTYSTPGVYRIPKQATN